jgi:2,4-diaminopentanoate dehydrogenase
MTRGEVNGRHRVVVIGLGKLGLLFIERLSRRSDMELVGVVDSSASKIGRPLDDVAERSTGFDLVVQESVDDIASADVALVATASKISAVSGLLEELCTRGLHTVSTCEELAYPWRRFPEESQRLDAAARSGGVAIVGCGSNPGFLMDLLPSVFAFGCERVDSLTIQRTLDMRPHRPERLTRFGLGLTPSEFDALASPPTGHVGFTESIDCVADVLGWDLDRRVESAVRPAVLASAPRSGRYVTLESGTVAVIEHSASGYRDGEEVISLTSYFGFHDEDDSIFHGDVYTIGASDHPIRIEMAPSWSPFTGTPSTVVNMVGPIREAEPGLRCVVDFSAKALGASGRGVKVDSALPIDDYLVSSDHR